MRACIRGILQKISKKALIQDSNDSMAFHTQSLRPASNALEAAQMNASEYYSLPVYGNYLTARRSLQCEVGLLYEVYTHRC